MRQNAITIEQFNSTLCNNTKIKVVDFEQFKKLHMEQGTRFEQAVAHIDCVKRLENGYKLVINKVDNKQKIIKILFNGLVSVNNRKFYMPIDHHKEDGHIRLSINNSSTPIEKLILTCEAILNNTLPESFKGICVNVMSGCGNVYTADRLGLPLDFTLSNLEWTYIGRNSRHGNNIDKIYKLVNQPCSYSANDEELYEKLAFQDDEAIIKHLEENYL